MKKNMRLLLVSLAIATILALKAVSFYNFNNAVAKEEIWRIELLLKFGADPNRRDSSGNTPLHLAAIMGNEKVVKKLLEAGADPNLLDEFGSSPIASATSFGHEKIVQLLIESKKSLDPFLLFKAALGGHAAVIDLLLKNGINPNDRFPNGATPLHAVAFGDHVNAAKILLKNGANVDASNDDGSTPLHLAAFYGSKRLVVLLIENGANIYLKDKKGFTPLDIARKNGHTSVETILQSLSKST